jgi:hypothetical protein
VSLDRGAHWDTLDAGLPNVPVHDLVVHPRDRQLVAATHGRSVWIVDALPVQELTPAVRAEPAHLFHVDEVQADRGWRSRPSRWFDETPYLPTTTIHYWAKTAGTGKLWVLNADKQLLREIVVEAQAGINRLEWNLLVDADLALAAERAKNDKLAEDARKAAETPEKATDTDDSGRLAKTPYAESVRLGHRLYLLPGDYTLQLQLAGHTSETPFVVAAPEPRKPRATPAPKIRGKED